MMNLLVLVFVGGAVGAMVREFLMLGVPDIAEGFPLSIFVANIVASALLGLASGLHQRRAISDDVNTLIGTGIMGGLSTFSSFVYGAFVLMTASAAGVMVAIFYVLTSLAAGYVAVIVGLKIGGRTKANSG